MKDYFDSLIDLALDTKDFEWVKELQQAKLEYTNSENKEKVNIKENEKVDTEYAMNVLKTIYDSGYEEGVKQMAQMINDYKNQINVLIETIKTLTYKDRTANGLE